MKSPVRYLLVLIALTASFSAAPTRACGGPGYRFFLEYQAHYLPKDAVQVRVALDTSRAAIARAALREATGQIVAVARGSSEFVLLDAHIVIDLETEPTSCHGIGMPDSDRFLVGFVRQVERDGKMILMLKPIPYPSVRSYSDEIDIARQYDER